MILKIFSTNTITILTGFIVCILLMPQPASAQCTQATCVQGQTYFGWNAGMSLTTGNNNCFFGSGAGTTTTTGYGNAIFGDAAGFSNTGGENNSFFGRSAGQGNAEGDRNTFVGASSGLVSKGDNNTFVGYFAGRYLNGLNNICIGALAGPTAFNTLPRTFSNKLYIDIESNDNPLIYGEFDNHLIRINGSFEVMGGLTNPSSAEVKENFQVIERQNILDQLSQIKIQEWSYENVPDVRHVGPTAEDFHAAFGVGKDDKTISTIDADGVAFLAIQALNEKLQTEVGALQDKNRQLEERLVRLEKAMKE